MNFPELQQKAGRILVDNAEAILTAGGVIGTVATAILTGRSATKAASVVHQEALSISADDAESIGETFAGLPDLSTRDKVKLTWPLYVPPALVGTATVTSIVMANRISVQRAAALAAAYGISEGRLQEYKDKVAEKLTGPKAQAIQDDIAKDRVSNNPPGKQVVIVGGGDVLCYDIFTGRYFRSSVDLIKKAENEVNQELMGTTMAPASVFYAEIGLPATGVTDLVGWGGIDATGVEVIFSTIMTDDQQPCVAIDFSPAPTYNYDRLQM